MLSVSSCCLSLGNARIKFDTAAISLLLHPSLFVFLHFAAELAKQCGNKIILTYYATISFWKNTKAKCQNLSLSCRKMQRIFFFMFALLFIHCSFRFSLRYLVFHWIHEMAMWHQFTRSLHSEEFGTILRMLASFEGGLNVTLYTVRRSLRPFQCQP